MAMEPRPPPTGAWASPMTAQAAVAQQGRGPRPATLAAVVVVVVALVLTVAYLGHGQEGRFYNYGYLVEVDGATAAFCVTVPVPVIANGSAFPRIGLDRDLPVGCRLVSTERGLGLEVRGAGRTVVSLDGEYNACLHSEDHRSDSDPRLGMSTLNGTRPAPSETTAAWVRSDAAGLNVTVRFEAVWGNWVETPLGGKHVRGGAGYDHDIQGTTSVGWNEWTIDIGEIEVD
jgi:hypothetical protein